jgi:Transglycosylase SLT domain
MAKSRNELRALVKAAWERKHLPVPVEVAFAIVEQESGWDANARSQKDPAEENLAGNWGLCQISLDKARKLGFTGSPDELLNPAINAWMFAELAESNLRRMPPTIYNVIAAHNCGVTNVIKGTVPAATRDVYVPGVIALMSHYVTARAEERPIALPGNRAIMPPKSL